MTKVPILQTTTRALGPAILVFSLYLLWRGHDSPGGGFIAALVAGAGIVLGYLAYGPEGARRVLPTAPSTLLGLGLIVSTAYGIAGIIAGNSFLQGGEWTLRVPAVGEQKLAASLIFDVGVYLVVLAVVTSIIRYLGREEEAEA